MRIESSERWTPETSSDVLVLAIPSDSKGAKWLEQVMASSEWLRNLMVSDEVSSKPTKTSVHFYPPGLMARQLITVGIGEDSKRDPLTMFRAAGAASKLAASKARGTVAFLGFQGSPMLERAALAGAISGVHGQDLFRSEKSLMPPERLCWIGLEPKNLDVGKTIAHSVQDARRLVNLPPNYIHPESFVEEATRLCQDLPIQIDIWDEERLKAERCGSLLGVGQGSERSSRLMIFRYSGKKNGSPIAFVGKGVTFDSGGLSIKPTESMLTMKCDMAGAATVVGILAGAAKLQLSHPLIGVVGLVENMISGDCMKLGDVLTARSGKTIEVLNTDAEGRLVLADALDIAKENQPSSIIDFATLTGACVVALGTDIAGIMSNHPGLEQELKQVADRVGELVWPLPMHPFFSEQIAGKIADIKNVGDGRWAGAITAAKFLQEFVGDTPWAHFDIAGPAYYDAPKPWQDIGGTGVLIRSMLEWLMEKEPS